MKKEKSFMEAQGTGNEVTDIKCSEFGTTLEYDNPTPNYELSFMYGDSEVMMAEDGDYVHHKLEGDTICRIYNENRECFTQAVIPVLERMLAGEKISYGLSSNFQLELGRDNHFVLYDNLIDNNEIAAIPYPTYSLQEIAQLINDWAYGRCNHIKGRKGIWSIYNK